MPLPSETIALPLVKGLDVHTDARLVQAPALLEAENTQFSGGGAKKRRGHTALVVRTEDPIVLNPEPEATTWHYGIGGNLIHRPIGDAESLYWASDYPSVGRLSGVATRDNETVVWDGFRLLSYLPSQLDSQAPALAVVDGAACLPSLRAAPLAKYAEEQSKPEFADNGLTKTMVWINGTDPRYAIYDSTSDALIATGTLGVSSASYARVFTLGVWTHIAVLDSGISRVRLYSFSSYNPTDFSSRSLGDATHFDIWKQDDSEAVIARSFGSKVFVSWIEETGAGSSLHSPIEHDFSSTVSLVSVTTSDDWVGIFAYRGTVIACAVYISEGLEYVSGTITDSTSTVFRLTSSIKRAETASDNLPFFDVYWDDGDHTYASRLWITHTPSPVLNKGDSRVRHWVCLASRAWRTGDRTFFWASHFSALQSTWFLLDEGLLPVGKMNFGVADTGGFDPDLRGVNFASGEDYDSLTPKVQLALNYKMRVVPPGVDQATGGIYTEPSPQAVVVNFLPRLHAAQAGRSLYIAGAQLWAYDGQELVEAGFHLGPEPSLAQEAGGALTSEGTYSYRVDLCHRNAQNEEVRSLSILTDSVELDPGNQTISLNIPNVITRREDSYFLIYRNAMSSGTPLVSWWLLNSRDPASPDYLANDLSTPSFTYVDDGSVDDTEIQTREFHPASDTYVQPISAPACEIIAAGRDRLWVAGGELPPGKVAPSRLFDAGDTPSFNAYLEFQVDRSNEPVTAIGFIGEVAVIFRPNSTYLLDSDGPDNNASGLWNYPRLALTDIGAVSQASVARISQGLLFQSPAGFRLVGPGGALNPMGQDIDSEVQGFDVVGAVVDPLRQEVRFYGSDEAGTFVFNYREGTWAHWTCGGVGVAKRAEGALIAREDGTLWLEGDVWRDGDRTYTHRIRTSWLHGGSLGDFQRVRRVGGLGRFADLSNPAHTLRLEFYYDERDFWEERIEWSQPDNTQNLDTWGSETWGAGVWGDNSATINNLKDNRWEWVRRPGRQKCSVISIALEDVNTDGPGFELSAFTLELARKSGLNRTPERS